MFIVYGYLCFFFDPILMMKRILLFSILCISSVNFAQLDIKVLSYNVLNYYGDTDSRDDTLAKILNYYTPDLFMVQEIKSELGFNEIVETLNGVNSDPYVGGTFVEQTSNPGSTWKLQQNIVYNTRIFGLAAEDVITSSNRDVNYFKLYIKEENLTAVIDTIFLHVFVTHLKSSQGTANEALRLEQSQVMRTAINALPANSNVLCGGDFNLYTSTEDAYIHLLETGLTNTLEDPIDMPGNWHDSGFSNKEILTQSTRLNALSDGASGGMDDRFDFVLHSEELSQGNSSLSYVAGTYKALGNNGTCYNQDLIDCTTVGNVPYTMLSALYHFSDHLPVVFTLTSDALLAVSEMEATEFSIYPNPAEAQLSIKVNTDTPLVFEMHDLSGKLIFTKNFNSFLDIDVATFPTGMYHGILLEKGRVISTEKIVVK
jgi:endonuclease/exonuclease/phosphatase family metal-dependent hydrolase